MTLLTGYDAAFPPANPPKTDVVLFYAGGDTPHVWTMDEIAAQPARWRLPIFVRSDPWSKMGPVDAKIMLDSLTRIGCPSGVTTVLDLETAVTRQYVLGYGAGMHAAGFLVIVYGSRTTVMSNPALDGYFVATWGHSTAALPPGWAAMQYENLPAWDLDLITSSLPLWDTGPPAPETGDPDMILVRTTTSGAIVLLDGGTATHLDGPTSVAAFQAAGVKLIEIADQEDFRRLTS